MTNGFQQVQPGDLITHTFMNDLIDKLLELESRVAQLESGGMVITRFEPADGQRINERLEIHGTNFVFPVGQNTVTIGGVEVNSFLPGSTSTQLNITVPEVPNVPAAGREVLLEIRNVRGIAQRFYRILQAADQPEPPAITSVEPVSGAGTTLVIGQAARITGERFAAEAAGNTVIFSIGQGRYQVTPSSVSGTPPRELTVTVPDISEIPSGTDIVFIEVSVDGRSSPTAQVAVRRSG